MQNSVLHSTTQSELAWAAQINIWLMITDIYLKLDQPNQAVSSLDEASQISYTHPDVLYYVSFRIIEKNYAYIFKHTCNQLYNSLAWPGC